MAESTNRYAVVTGSNKGVGFETVRQLASKGITVVLTARDEERGLKAVEKLKQSGLSSQVVFHQLDVADPASIASLAEFIKIEFGKLDILVNNAGTMGAIVDVDGFKAAVASGAADDSGESVDFNKLFTETYELTQECVQINYYGGKRTAEALIPLLQLSDSPRIVNVTSSTGKLKNIPSDWVKGVLSADVENLFEESVDEVLTEFLSDFKDGLRETKGWPSLISAYTVSKAAMNAYTRILAKKYPGFRVNSLCPGFVKTDINFNAGVVSVEEGASHSVRLALLPGDGPSGKFFVQSEVRVKVVLTALDEKRGHEAIEKLKDYGFSDLVVYHQLDVTDPNSIASLVDFVKSQFGKLYILFSCKSSLSFMFPSHLIIMAELTKRCAVVTGSNKGIGFETVKQLASNGTTVVLTARDEKKGLEAVEKLKESGLSGQVVFHQLDVADPASIASLAHFIKTQFGKLDILVNNAGIVGGIIDADRFRAASECGVEGGQNDWTKFLTDTYELTEECLQVNYYGAKRTAEALIPLLQLADSPRVVNVSSSMGKLKKIPSDRVKGVLSADVENLSEDSVDQVLTDFLNDLREGLLENKGWPSLMSGYTVSKAAINAYTRILAKKYPGFRVNSVCPGYVKTDINFNNGFMTVGEGAASVVNLALLPDNGPTGQFFFRFKVSCL
ncbi:uncharacterized protein LOC126803613 [Argentina anserina]|uniref:uncharacterized protein LOC126803613 n=1 Tax=Argentina anserina TaxID=57926 RepID=UPI002176357B|nr:uncharacterized protein LOC126803613 [Potentilla anserina]